MIQPQLSKVSWLDIVALAVDLSRRPYHSEHVGHE